MSKPQNNKQKVADVPRKTKRNNLTSPELISQINPENMSLKEGFLDYLKSTERSEGTIKGYSNDLDIFFVFYLQQRNNKSFADIDKQDIIAFQNWLINENGNSPARVRRIKSTLSSISDYIINILDDDPRYKDFKNIIGKVKSPVNRATRQKTVLPEERMERFLKELVDLGEYEKACMLALAMYSGRRKSELTRFRVTDFKDENLVCDRALYKTSELIRTKGFGKGKYIYCYTLANKFKPYFDLWMKYREENGIESEWLFPMKGNPTEQIKAETLNSWALTFSRMLGVDFYFHSMRHYFTTSLIRAGLPDSVVQSIIGWTSSDMVRLYTDIPTEEHIGMYFKNGEISIPQSKGFDL